MTLKPVPTCRDPPEVAELDEARSLALSLGQAGAAVAASMGRAKLCGLLVDRREDVTRRPTRDPGAPAEVAVEVRLREVAPSAGDERRALLEALRVDET